MSGDSLLFIPRRHDFRQIFRSLFLRVLQKKEEVTSIDAFYRYNVADWYKNVHFIYLCIFALPRICLFVFLSAVIAVELSLRRFCASLLWSICAQNFNCCMILGKRWLVPFILFDSEVISSCVMGWCVANFQNPGHCFSAHKKHSFTVSQFIISYVIVTPSFTCETIYDVLGQ